MGRRSRSSVAVVSGYSSNSTAGSSFRELDDAFLQKQTRIWLGEVLNTRLDEQVDISDLLADGELLHDVSEVLWNLLLTKCAELWRLKANLKGPTASRKIGGRYMPYSNVDSFLKICKIFGLNGIDLFSPSDVVEKKNIRKVCICIRALSKKARSKQLHLPDFDIVTYAVAMPTDMVECLKKSLESPQSSFASSSTYNSYEQPRSKLKQVRKLVFAGDVKNNDVSSEESDEAESNCRGADSHLSSIDKLEISDVLDSDLENSPGAYSSTKIQKDVAGDGDISLQNEYVASDKSHYSTEERDYISEYLAFSDSVVLGTDGGSPILFDGEESTYNFFTGIDAHGSNLKGRDFETGSIDDEVSSTTSMSSILGRVLAMEFDDRFDIDDMLPTKDHPETFQDSRGTTGRCETEDMDDKKMTPKDGLHDNFDIDPAGCIPAHEDYQPSVELVDNACIKGHQTSPSVEKDTDFPEFTNQDSQQPVVVQVSERTDNEQSHIKPHRKLFNRVAKGTAIAGVLFFLLQLSKRIGDEKGKLGKKSRPTQIFGHSKRSKQDGNQGSKRTVTSPDGVFLELGLLHQARAGLMRGEALIKLVRERVKAANTRLGSKL